MSQTADVDFKQELGTDEARLLHVRKILRIHPYWDMALLAMAGLGEDECLKLSTVDPGGRHIRPDSVAHWKVVVSREHGALRSFAFLLEQDPSGVDLEFAVDVDWPSRMIWVGELEELLGVLRLRDTVTRPTRSSPRSGSACACPVG